MTWWQRLWQRSHMEAQLEKELRFHIEQHTEQLIASGDDRDQARQALSERGYDRSPSSQEFGT